MMSPRDLLQIAVIIKSLDDHANALMDREEQLRHSAELMAEREEMMGKSYTYPSSLIVSADSLRAQRELAQSAVFALSAFLRGPL